MSITESHASEALVTKREAMDVLRVSLRTVDRYIAAGTLSAVRLSERNTKITRSSLEAMLEPTSPVDDSPVVDGPPAGEATPSVSPAPSLAEVHRD